MGQSSSVFTKPQNYPSDTGSGPPRPGHERGQPADTTLSVTWYFLTKGMNDLLQSFELTYIVFHHAHNKTTVSESQAWMFVLGFVFNPIFTLMHWWFAAAASVANLALTNLASLVVLACLLINDGFFTFHRPLTFVSVFRCYYTSKNVLVFSQSIKMLSALSLDVSIKHKQL